jgi:hypothetical protein
MECVPNVSTQKDAMDPPPVEVPRQKGTLRADDARPSRNYNVAVLVWFGVTRLKNLFYPIMLRAVSINIITPLFIIRRNSRSGVIL